MPEPTSGALPDDFEAYEAVRNAPPVEEVEEVEEETSGADEAESVEESEPSKEEQEKKAEDADLETKGGIKKRFSKLTKTIRELEAQLIAKATPPPEPKQAAATPAPVPEGKPTAENFDTYEAYIESLTDWKLEQREQKRAAEETQKAVGEAWNTRLDEARTRYEDFDDVVSVELPISAAMQQTIVGSEHGPDLAYYLASNPAETARIAQLAPLAAAMALGKIEAGFAKEETPETPKPKLTSSAPKPPTPVAARGAAPSKSIYDEKLAGDFNAWERTRNAQLSRK